MNAWEKVMMPHSGFHCARGNYSRRPICLLSASNHWRLEGRPLLRTRYGGEWSEGGKAICKGPRRTAVAAKEAVSECGQRASFVGQALPLAIPWIGR